MRCARSPWTALPAERTPKTVLSRPAPFRCSGPHSPFPWGPACSTAGRRVSQAQKKSRSVDRLPIVPGDSAVTSCIQYSADANVQACPAPLADGTFRILAEPFYCINPPRRRQSAPRHLLTFPRGISFAFALRRHPERSDGPPHWPLPLPLPFRLSPTIMHLTQKALSATVEK